MRSQLIFLRLFCSVVVVVDVVVVFIVDILDVNVGV